MVRVALALLLAIPALPQSKSLSLATADGLTLHNTSATPVTFKGKKALKVTASGNAADAGPSRADHLALIDGVEFSNGTIEADLAGEPGSAAAEGARGFVGIAFRVQGERTKYDCFYLRPTNGRAEDQERRNHSAQYISHPEFTWSKLRQETPSRYESYVDIQPAEWIHVKIQVEGTKARLYVNGASHPTLIVNDVKSGALGKGAVALWFEGSTVAHFANVNITPK
ncbi:MAG: hypothetical protein U0Q16_15855 [Bryobacteraceae bacterium]